MRQLTLRGLFGCNDDECVARARSGSLEVYDLFCGAGGFSTGARTAGCTVVFACDSSVEAIETHKRNHPSTTHRVCTLPCALPLPTDGRPFHLHGSPPCQKFSSVNKGLGDWRHKDAAIDMVEWYLEYALASRATSWSMEQVPAREVLEVVERVRRKHSRRMAYAVLRLDKLGVPQTRKRLVAGSPHLIAKLLRESRQQPTRTVRSVIAKPRGTHVRGGNKKIRQTQRIVTLADGSWRYEYDSAKWSDFCCPIDGLSPTVTGRHALNWITGNGEGGNRSVMHPWELAALQTFPLGYKLPTNKYQAYLQVGNAVPPRVAELMLHGENRNSPVSPSLRRSPGPIGEA